MLAASQPEANMRNNLSHISFLFWLVLFGTAKIQAQESRGEGMILVRIDSLEKRIGHLQNQVNRYKQTRDVNFYNVQRELDLSLFLKTYEEYALEEDLDMAKSLVEKRLERAKMKSDQYTIDFYNRYKDDVFKRIKAQRIYYQALFEKERNFRRELDRVLVPENPETYRKGRRTIELALKYASENNLVETVSYLKKYLAFADALEFDRQSDFDLNLITRSESNFKKAFLPLADSDSLGHRHEALQLVDHCISYAGLSGSPLSQEFLSLQKLYANTSLTEMLERDRRETDIGRYTSQAITARTDTLNPCGVFKWHNQVIVIDEFSPTASMETVKKGEAIMFADKMLSAYLTKNKLCTGEKDLRYGNTFIIPYQSNAKQSAFYFNPLTKKWQFIACYTMIIDESFTEQVSRFMPPLQFTHEKDLVLVTRP